MPSVGGTVRSKKRHPGAALSVWGSLWSWSVLAFVLGLLLGRAPVLGRPGPFGLAWVAALRISGAPAATISALAVALGMAGQSGGLLTGGGLRALTAAAVVWFVTHRRNAKPAGPTGTAGTASGAGKSAAADSRAAALAAAVAAAVGTGMVSTAPLDWLGTALEAGIAAVLAAAMAQGITVAPDSVRPAPGPSGALLVAILLFGLVAGVLDVQVIVVGVPPLPLASALGGLAVLVTAWSAGPLAGATSGLLVGLAVLLASPPGLPALLRFSAEGTVFATAGLLAGVFRDLGRIGCATGYLLAFVFLRALRQDAPPSYVWGEVLAGAVAALGLFVVPRAWLQEGTARSVVGGLTAAIAPPASRTAGRQLLPEMVRSRIGALARLLEDVHTSLVAATRPADPPPAVPDAVAPLVGQVVERVCRECRMYRHCWENEFYRTYQVFSRLWERVESESPLPTRLPPEELQRFCAYPGEVIASLNAVHDLMSMEREAQSRMRDGRSVLALQVQAISGMLGHLAGSLEEPAPATSSDEGISTVRYRLRTGVAWLPKRGSLVSGDSHRMQPLGHGRHLIALSDGMGAGRGAAAGSQEALGMLVDLLEAGYPVEAAVQLVNATMVLKDPESEHFATLDVAVVDLHSGRTDLVKVGAPPSVLVRGRDVQLIRAEVPPAGIVYPLPLETELRVLRPEDWLVLATDGLWAREGEQAGDRWLLDFLSSHQATDPDELAQVLLARALAGAGEGPADDITVVAARLEPMAGKETGTADGSSGQRTAPNAPGCVPVRRAPSRR